MMQGIPKSEEIGRQLTAYISDRITAMAAEEIELARERMKARIPELAAEIGVRVQQAMAAGPFHLDAVLQIVLTPRVQR